MGDNRKKRPKSALPGVTRPQSTFVSKLVCIRKNRTENAVFVQLRSKKDDRKDRSVADFREFMQINRAVDSTNGDGSGNRPSSAASTTYTTTYSGDFAGSPTRSLRRSLRHVHPVDMEMYKKVYQGGKFFGSTTYSSTFPAHDSPGRQKRSETAAQTHFQQGGYVVIGNEEPTTAPALVHPSMDEVENGRRLPRKLRQRNEVIALAGLRNTAAGHAKAKEVTRHDLADLVGWGEKTDDTGNRLKSTHQVSFMHPSHCRESLVDARRRRQMITNADKRTFVSDTHRTTFEFLS